ncbi:hypothetical protein Tco_0414677 [Tanacetum coccineum]
MEETDTLLSHSDDSLPDYETFCFDIEEKSSGSTTSYSDHSLPDYETFCFDIDHQEEKSSGSTTSHSDLSLPNYKSFYFEEKSSGSTTSKSDHSLPNYEAFCFEEKSSGRELTRLLKENISDTSTKDLTVNKLNDFLLLLSDCDSSFSEDFSEIDLLVSFPSGNEDKVFDPEILIIDGVFYFTRKSPPLLIDNFMIDNCHILSEISLKIISSINFHPKDKEIRR